MAAIRSEKRVALGELDENNVALTRGRGKKALKTSHADEDDDGREEEVAPPAQPAMRTPPPHKQTDDEDGEEDESDREAFRTVSTPDYIYSPCSIAESTPAPPSPSDQIRCGSRPRAVPAMPALVSLDEAVDLDLDAPPFLIPPQPETPHDGKLTVVFDLDETLVSNRRPGACSAHVRNYFLHMAQLLKGLVEVVLWTASTPQTGQPVVQQIDPRGEFFHHVVYRHDGWFTEGTHTKDLKLLGRDMDKVIIVENTPNCCKLNPQNAILVEDFVGNLREPDRTLLGVATVVRGACEAARYGVPVSQYLREYACMQHSALLVYELHLPTAFNCVSKEEAMQHIETLDPLHRPPLGLYYYVRKN
ncbi:hypothetical protein DIPPA_26067 [Diplonema papillatum]|nr:hypothetical protein DIPPA_26067 [Diplonema papillatum]